MKSLEKAYHYLFCALVFTIPFEDDIRVVPNILIALLALLLPFAVKNVKQKLFSNKVYIITIGLVVFLALSSVVSKTFIQDIFVLKKLGILVAVLLLSLPIQNRRSTMLCFISAITLGNIISMFNIGIYIYEVGGFEIASGKKINSILFLERLYFGFVNCLSIAFSLKLWPKSNKKLKKGFVVNIALSVFLIFLVASRMAIITCLLICVIKTIYHTNTKKASLAIIIGVGVIATMFMLNDNLAKRFIHSDKQKDFIHKVKEWEPRFVIWKCGLSHFKSQNHRLFFGDGFYNTQQSLNDCYISSISKEKRLKYFLETRFNTHNQYMDFLLSKGLLGLGVFLLILFSLARKNRNNIDQLNILLVLIMFSLIENFLHRQIGVYLFGLILVVLTLKKSEDNILDE